MARAERVLRPIFRRNYSKPWRASTFTRINYKGASQAVTDLLGGHVQLMFGNPGSAGAHVKSGRLKAIAVSSAQPSALDPSLPPVARTLPGYELVEYLGLLAPAKPPAAIVNRWNQAVGRLLSTADLKEKFLNTGSEVATGSPEQFAAAIKSDMTKLGKVIKDARIRGD